VSAKEAFFYALMFVALGMTAWHIVDLGFDLIDRWFSDAERAYWGNRSIRWSISALIVFFPLFMIMQRTEARSLARDPSRKRSAVRKWFGYIALFFSSITLLGDLLGAIYALLNGDLTTQFIAELALVAAVAGTVFGYFQGAMKDAEDGN
jgi:membrane protein YqaA with SNARE-associated domain